MDPGLPCQQLMELLDKSQQEYKKSEQYNLPIESNWHIHIEHVTQQYQIQVEHSQR